MTPDKIVPFLTEHLGRAEFKPSCDLADLGNEIGIALGRFVDKNKMGYELESLISGIRHGVSLVDGTH